MALVSAWSSQDEAQKRLVAGELHRYPEDTKDPAADHPANGHGAGVPQPEARSAWVQAGGRVHGANCCGPAPNTAVCSRHDGEGRRSQ